MGSWQNQLYRFFWAKNSTSLRKNEGFRPIKIICRRTFLVSISMFSTLFHFISLFHRGIWYLACEQQTHIRSSLRSLRKIASANPSGKTISVTWSLLFWCWPIRSKDRIRLEWLLATSRAEASWISARVTKYVLERAWISRPKQGFLRRWMPTSLWSNCFLSYVCDVALWFRFMKYGSTWHKKKKKKKWTK